MPWINGFWAGLSLAMAAAQTSPPPPPQQIPAPLVQTTPAVPAPAAPKVAPRFLVVIDAAHGGNDTGARLSDTLPEKTLTLNLSVRLRSMLAARGIAVITTRESDAALSSTQRAALANHEPAAACILIHATASGSGVHLYTSSLAPESPAQGVRFLPWQTAQAVYVTQSMKLSSEIDSAFAHAEIPVALGRTSLQPMDSFACPAVAVEIAPLVAGTATKGRALTDADYQKSILDALAAAIDEWKNDWRQQP
jgi:N-acetylmuramoyl-L-alanine amidase